LVADCVGAPLKTGVSQKRGLGKKILVDLNHKIITNFFLVLRFFPSILQFSNVGDCFSCPQAGDLEILNASGNPRLGTAKAVPHSQFNGPSSRLR
jgi:hypothetical protein